MYGSCFGGFSMLIEDEAGVRRGGQGACGKEKPTC